MIAKVNLPKTGMGIEEGIILRWHKREGDRVSAGEMMVEVENAKAVQEIEAPVSGVLSRILVSEGETVAVNTDLAPIEEDAR